MVKENEKRVGGYSEWSYEEKLRLYENIFSSLQDGISILDAQMNILLVNPKMEEWYAHKMPIVGKKCHEIYVGKNERCKGCSTYEAIKTGKPTSMVVERLGPDGKILTWLHISSFPLIDAKSGRVEGAIEYVRDVREHKEVERVLGERVEQYRLIAENTADVIAILDLDLRFTYVSPSVLRMYGYTIEEAVGASLEWVLTPESFRRVREVFDEEMRLELCGSAEPWRTRTLELQEYRKDGSLIWVETNISILRDREGHPIGILTVNRDITARKLAEEACRLAEDKFSKAFRSSPSMMVINSLKEGRYIEVNEVFLKVFGYERDEVIGRTALELGIWADSGDRELILSELERVGYVRNREVKGRKRSGEVMDHLLSVEPLEIGGERYLLWTSVDITEYKRVLRENSSLQEQLQQSQKMEAIGRLAGGIAHDFNNLLTVIKGNCELQMINLHPGDPMKVSLEEINRAVQKAADLIRHILAFSRKQIMEMRVFEPNELIMGLEKMLRRLIGEDIELVIELADGVGRIKADPGQIEQVIINIVVNARDAMPQGGRLFIETANVDLEEDYERRHMGVVAGRYVMISISDTGVGMTPEVRERIFEPFFTTKELGRGTGLGLSTVYGIIKQSGGNIWVYSEPGRGATFKIYLPRVEDPLSERRGKETNTLLPKGSETLLVVEDEENVRAMAISILTKLGYRVLSASDGGEALRIYKEQGSSIDLILTDVVMPSMSGREMVERMGSGLKVLYMSGYTDEIIAHHGVLLEGIEYIQKPFTLDRLARKIREILDR